jgi:hypothetical protein
MEIIRLRPHHLRTGDENVNLRLQRAALEAASRNMDRSYSPDSSQVSIGSTLVPNLGSKSGYGYAPRKISLNNIELQQRQLKSAQEFYKQNKQDSRSKIMQDSDPPSREGTTGPPGRFRPKPDSLPDNLNTSRTLDSDLSEGPDDAESDLFPPSGFRNEESQTRRYNLMKVYLPGIKEHTLWRREKGDPFLEVS